MAGRVGIDRSFLADVERGKEHFHPESGSIAKGRVVVAFMYARFSLFSFLNRIAFSIPQLSLSEGRHLDLWLEHRNLVLH